ncbi:MAG TPA: plasma-membrane proton-efflux P-type ATPase [Xanthobacteraceae bacterium]|nr:plasma-membrane proton-efflux P-type ATPase [Xanthobacteraceae bacterium]
MGAGGDPSGLTNEEARRRLAELGPNAVSEAQPPRWRAYAAKYWSPVAWLLEGALVVEIGLGKYVEAAVIAGLLLFNATLGFVQEGRATTALALLKKRLAPTALARRDGAWVRLPAAELVPGDAITLSLGGLVPADARLGSGSVVVDQSTLTGESIPVDKNPGDAVYAGSLVRHGRAVAEVVATGPRTYFGRTADLVRTAHARSTEQAAIFAATRNLAIVNAVVAAGMIAYAFVMAFAPGDLVPLALTALLATIPAALPATFTVSAAFGAQSLARRGVLLTRLSAVHEAAALDVLCADKTGTLTRNELKVVDVVPFAGCDRARVLAFAALASSEADQDPIDAAVCAAAAVAPHRVAERLVRFVPFDPATKSSEALIVGQAGSERRVIKGAFEMIAKAAELPDNARTVVDGLGAQGQRVLAVAYGPPDAVRLVGLVAISDPPRDDSASLIAELKAMGVRTVMVTGDSATTATAIARQIGIEGDTCSTDSLSAESSVQSCGVFARVIPEMKFKLVRALQNAGHVVGMCGDGVNDAPALQQAQIGIAVSSATDVAKAAAGMVLTEPGLAGIVVAVREGRVGFQRLSTYTFNMLTKKIEIVLFLAIGLILTGRAVMTPVLMVLMLVTNDFLAMSLTTDRASPSPTPSQWRMSNITGAAIVLGVCKLAFSTAMLAMAKYWLGLGSAALQTFAFVTLVFGAQGLIYVLRERRHLWSSMPSRWVFVSSAVDIGIAVLLALTGTLMAPLQWPLLLAVFAGAAAFAVILDQIKQPVTALFDVR